MNKFEETYLNIIREEAIPKAQLVDTKEGQTKVGKKTTYTYENEEGSFKVSYEPYGSEPPYTYKYIVSRVEIKEYNEADTTLHYFDSLEEAVKYGEQRIISFKQQRINYYNGLADWARKPRSGWYLD